MYTHIHPVNHLCIEKRNTDRKILGHSPLHKKRNTQNDYNHKPQNEKNAKHTHR